MQYKQITNGYIDGLGSCGTSEITETEYAELLEVISNKPTAPEGYDYRLKDTLEWELYELPPTPIDDDLTAEEALNIITGGYAE